MKHHGRFAIVQKPQFGTVFMNSPLYSLLWKMANFAMIGNLFKWRPWQFWIVGALCINPNFGTIWRIPIMKQHLRPFMAIDSEWVSEPILELVYVFFLHIYIYIYSNSFSRQIGTECRRWRRDSWCSTPARLSPIFLKGEKGKMGWRGGVTIASSGLSDFPCARPASLSDTNLWWWWWSNWWL